MSGVTKEAIKMVLIPTSNEKKKKDNLPAIQNTHKLESSPFRSCRPYFSDPTVIKWPENPFMPTMARPATSKKSRPFSNVDSQIVEPTKRTISKLNSGSRKKSKMKNLETPDEEKNLDTDLFAMVESMETDKNLDSDSSTDTIIEDGINNSKTVNDSKKLHLQTIENTNAVSLNEKDPSTLHKKVLPKTDLNSQNNDNRVNSSAYPKSSYSLLKGSMPSLSLLKEALAKSSPAVEPAISNVGNVSNSLLSFATTEASPVFKSNVARKVQPRCFMYDSQVVASKVISSQNIKKACKFPSTNKFEKSPINQSIYASMGLDEDLCDVKTLKIDEKLNYSAASEQNLLSTNKTPSSCPDLTVVPIKTEINITPPTSPGKGEGINDMHVSMTFETDPYDNDPEDDLPLSFLKDRVVDASEANIDSKTVTSSLSNNNFAEMSVFIKKELIEDEIAAESSETFSNKFSFDNSYFGSRANAAGSNAMKSTLDSAADLVPRTVNVKPELNTEFESSVSPFKTPCSESGTRKLSPRRRAKKRVQRNIKNNDEIISNISTTSTNNSALSNKNLVDVNSSTISATNADIHGNASDFAGTDLKDCTASSVSKVNVFPDVLSSSPNCEPDQVKSSVGSTTPHDLLTFETQISPIKTKTKKKTNKQSKIKTNSDVMNDTIKENSQNVVLEQLSSVPEISTNTDLGNSDLSSSESTASKKKVKRKKPAKKSITTNYFDSDISSSDSTASRRKGSKNKPDKKAVDLDENLPITLLIKRRKTGDTDVDGADTFLCTSINKSGISKTNEYDLSTENASSTLESSILNSNLGISRTSFSHDLHSEAMNTKEQLVENVDSHLTGSQSSGVKKKSVKKGKNAPKKKSTKKNNKKVVPDNLEENKISSIPDDNALTNNLEKNLVNVKECDSAVCDTAEIATNDTNASNSSSLIKKPAAPNRKNSDTFVYMSFEEQDSPVDETSEYLQSILSIKKEMDLPLQPNNVVQSSYDSTNALSVVKNIKKESEFISDSESKNFEQSKSIFSREHRAFLLSSPASQISSELSCSPSSLNTSSQLTPSDSDQMTVNSSVNSSPSKKKKKKPRSFGWCKKKKNKSKKKSPSKSRINVESSSVALSNAIIPLPETKDLQDVAAKSPVVIVENLLPDIEKAAVNDKEEIQEENLYKEDIVSPVEGKSKKKAVKRKVTLKSKAKSRNKKLLLEIAETANDEVLDISQNNTVDSHIVSEKTDFENLSVKDNVKSTISKSANEETLVCDAASDKNQNHEIIDISDSPIKPPCTIIVQKKFESSLINVAEIQQEIAGLENFVQFRESCIKAANKNMQDGENSCKLNLTPQNTPISAQNSNFSNPISTNENTSLSSDSLRNSRPEHSSGLDPESCEFGNKSIHAPLVSIKREIKDDCEIIVQKNTVCPKNLNSLFDSCDTVSSVQNSVFNKTQNVDSNLFTANLASIKQEASANNVYNKCTESLLFSNSNCRSDVSNSLLAIHEVSNNLDTIEPHSSDLNRTSSFESSQSSSGVFVDKFALSIKKEVSSNIKPGPSQYTSVNSIRSQNDLIDLVSRNQSKSLTNVPHGSRDNIEIPTGLPASLFESSATGVLNTTTKNVTDDEIQVLEVDTEKSKNVPCVDLTDDNKVVIISDNQGNKLSVNCGKSLSNEQFHLNESNENLYVKNVQVSPFTNAGTKENTSAFTQNNQPVAFKRRNSESPSVSERDIASPLLNRKTYDLPSGFEDEDLLSSNNRKTIDPFIFRQKYVDEYFKCPFPPSVVLFNCKPRNKHKIYTRINSQSLNLSIEKVESRLKNSDNAKNQFGNKLGDIVKLTKYPVRTSEVECYHRILGVAPSHKLLSRCFKNSDKTTSTILSREMIPEFQRPSSAFEAENNQPSHLNCSINDIIQGISEYKEMYSLSDFQNNSAISDRDCPSTNTIDSCDSHISNLSDKFVNAIQKKELRNVNILKETELPSVSQDVSSSGRNSVLSCTASDFQDSTKYDLTNTDLSAKNSVEGLYANNANINEDLSSQNILNYLTLPSKEILDSLVNNKCNSSFPSIEALCANTGNVDAGKESFSSSEPHLLSDSHKPNIFSPSASVDLHTEYNTNIESNTVQNITNAISIDLPVTELRKILEVAGTLCSDESHSESNLWKNKETFEYNHTTQSVPIEETHSEHGLEDTKACNTPITPSVVDDETDTAATDDNFFDDDDYVDNEPINYESDLERNEMSDSKEKEEDEPKIPQYKSRWDKIMERKSLENKEKEQINKHLLKDCFPISTKVPSKKCNVPDESVKSIHKKVEKMKKKESSEKSKTDIKGQDVKKKASEIGKKTDIKVQDAKKKASEIGTKTNIKVQNAKKKASEIGTKTNINVQDAKKKASEIQSKNKVKAKTMDNNGAKPKDSKKISKSTIKNKRKNTSIEDSSNLFAPDKPVKSSDEKKEGFKSNDQSKCFYGNRVTNRGTFLTDIEASERLKKIKIPKKKTEVSKKLTNVRSEEFHSMVKSPDINIPQRFVSPYKIVKKSNSYNKREGNLIKIMTSDTHSSTSTYLPRKEKLQDRRMSFSDTQPTNLFHSSYEDNTQTRKNSLINIPLLSQNRNDESIPFRKASQLSPPLSFHTNNESIPSRNVPLLNIPSSSFHPRDESLPNRRTSLLSTPPSSSFEFLASSSFSSDQTPPMSLLQSIISSVQSNSQSVTPKNNILPFPECLNPTWNNNTSLTHDFKEQPTFSDQSDSMSDSLSTSASYAADLPSSSNAQNSIPGRLRQSQVLFQDQLDAAFKAKGLLNDPMKSNQMPNEILKKTTCLVPQNLKTLVGNETIETANVRLLMLEWSVDWLMQQQKNKDPPPISNGLKKVVSSYDSFEDYYNTYFPLMLLDTWHRIYVSWTHLNQTSPYFCEITSYSVKSTFVSIECQTVFNKTAHPKGVFPDDGSILMIKYGTKSKDFDIKILGYVTNVKTRHFNPVTDSKLCNYKPPKDGNFEVLQILNLTFMGAYNSKDIDKRLPIRIHVLCNVKSSLKQNDALLYISKSPLQAIILNPVEDGLLNISLIPRNSPQDKVNECVTDITKGILSPHPLPLLTVVSVKPESDRLNIIPLLIEKMKTAYKTKVLLCVRTIRALGDIAANICLHNSLKLVIVNKRRNTNVQFQRYLLDELVTTEMSRTGDQSAIERPHLRNEAVIKIKKQIFRNCDVILSLIRNCHDEFMETTFTETESVAQMCCIVDEANLCTEPETLIPILHGVSKLILIGDPDYPAKVLSKTAKDYNYNQSFFNRAYDLDSITE